MIHPAGVDDELPVLGEIQRAPRLHRREPWLDPLGLVAVVQHPELLLRHAEAQIGAPREVGVEEGGHAAGVAEHLAKPGLHRRELVTPGPKVLVGRPMTAEEAGREHSQVPRVDEVEAAGVRVAGDRLGVAHMLQAEHPMTRRNGPDPERRLHLIVGEQLGGLGARFPRHVWDHQLHFVPRAGQGGGGVHELLGIGLVGRQLVLVGEQEAHALRHSKPCARPRSGALAKPGIRCYWLAAMGSPIGNDPARLGR